jgi:hypothetical protein
MASNREGVKTLSPGAQQLCGRPEVLVVAAARISHNKRIADVTRCGCTVTSYRSSVERLNTPFKSCIAFIRYIPVAVSGVRPVLNQITAKGDWQNYFAVGAGPCPFHTYAV